MQLSYAPLSYLWRGVLAALALSLACSRPPAADAPRPAKRLYWFIPDGLRAEPELFTLFAWAQQGKLPNIRKMMERGAYGYSIPDFPSHTPTNFATLLTGAHPSVHGIADGPMHVEGAPLAAPAVGGFSSGAKRVPPIWKLLEQGGMRVALVAIPGSTPPELQNGIVVRGRWGGWGADTPAVVFEPKDKLAERRDAGKAFKLFFLGQRLTEFVPTATVVEGSGQSLPARQAQLAAYGLTLEARIVDSTNDGVRGYDRVILSRAGQQLWSLAPGETSSWQPVELTWKDLKFSSEVRARVIKLWGDGSFRIRLFFDNANRLNTVPPEIAEAMSTAIGPMVDFADNWPAQLVYEPEDKVTFLEEAKDSLAWHRRAAGYFFGRPDVDVLIQDTYTPNQMLESRWWMREVDPKRPGHDPARAAQAWEDLMMLYQGIDAVIGEAMAKGGDDALYVLSSDHGIASLLRQVRLNNLFAERGWLRFTIDPATGEPAIDWARTKVVYLKMAHVYVHPDGLAGNWRRGSGPAYEALRREVIEALQTLSDEDGTHPLVRAATWEEAAATFGLPADRVGDLVLEARPGYAWWEEVTADGRLFAEPLGSGYKQAIDPRTTLAMWTPFVIMGPGVRAGAKLAEPIQHVDQLPTLLHLLDKPIPAHVEGRVLRDILE